MSAAITQTLLLLFLPVVGGPGNSPKSPTSEKQSAPETPETVVEVPPRYNPKRCPLPLYSQASRRKKEEGTVLLDIEVRADGVVSAVKLAKSSGFPSLDNAAKTAVASWRLFPATRNGVAVPGKARLPFQFFLEAPKPAKS